MSRSLFDSESMSRIAKYLAKNMQFEKNKIVIPKYGVIHTVLDSKTTKAIVGVGIVNYPIEVKQGNSLPEGYDVVTKEKVISDTKKGIRYVTIYSTYINPWAIGKLVHSDNNKYISANPNDLTQDNLGNLAFSPIFEDEY